MRNPRDGDDSPVGRVLSRREALILLGGAGASGLLLITGCGDGTDNSDDGNGGPLDCAAKPELTEGPYYVDENLTRGGHPGGQRDGGGSGRHPPGAHLQCLAHPVQRLHSPGGRNGGPVAV